jgi:ubiquinone/menaquinone biosynthesis C-methylase UbiE
LKFEKANEIMKIEQFLQCVVGGCNGGLVRLSPVSVECKSCQKTYVVQNNSYNLLPSKPPSDLESLWDTWGQLQDNGQKSYTAAPSLNLTGLDELGKRFSAFIQANGVLLDVGCGPQFSIPNYIDVSRLSGYIGLDPLIGQQPRHFNHVQAIGELIPLKNDCVDCAVASSSIDHMLSYAETIGEIYRVLRSGGKFYALIDDVDKEYCDTGFSKALHLISRGVSQACHAIKDLGLISGVKYIFNIATLPIPDGAKDYFHMDFPSPVDIELTLLNAGFVELEKEYFEGSILVSVKKPM